MKYLIFALSFLSFFSLKAQYPLDRVEIVAAIMPPNPDPSGIAVSQDGRVFLGFPRHADNHNEFSLAELKNGVLVPFPNKDYVYPSDKPYKDWLVSPHGMTMDTNGLLWVLDDGKRSGIAAIPEEAAKVVGIDINSGKIIHSIVISGDAMHNDSHLNDLRVDLSHGDKGMIYIANSSFGTNYSLVIVDIATGESKEVLHNHFSTSPEAHFMAFLEKQPHVYNMEKVTFPSGGADGISLSPDNKKLYWTAISSRNLYSISTDTLSDFSMPESEIESAVVFEGQHPACDGLAEDTAGNIYLGAFEQQSLVKRNVSGEYSLIVHDERFGWPDGLFCQDNYLYVTLGQWNRLPGFNNGVELRQPPFLVVRVKID